MRLSKSGETMTLMTHEQRIAAKIREVQGAPDKRPYPFKLPPRGVVCHETGKSFATGRQAAEACGVTLAAISRAIRFGGRAGGYHWRHKGQPLAKKRLTQTDHRKFPVRCTMEFPSINAAARMFRVHQGSISSALRNGNLCRGFVWTKVNP